MPYIKVEDRYRFDLFLNDLPPMETKGELEYCIYKLMMRYKANHAWKYSDLHDCTYAAQHCADEFRRHFLDVREDEARQKNGFISA